MKEILLVFMGGGAGSVLRYLLNNWIPKTTRGIPWPTFTANLMGCLLIGSLYAILSKDPDNNTFPRLLLITGFCGGFTTFSTFSIEIMEFLQSHQWTLAILYMSLSLLLCVTGCVLGYTLFK